VTFLDGFYQGWVARTSFPLPSPFSLPLVSSRSFFFFFFIASPSPVPGNISQLRGFMGHHKDTRCVSVAWWPTRVNFYYGCERLIRTRTTRETYPSTRIDLVEGRVFFRMATKRAERRPRDMPCRWATRLPRHEKFRLPGRPTPLPSFRDGHKLNELPLHP